MFTLLIGGSASGKSDLAEEMVCRLPGPRLYIATMHDPAGQGPEAALAGVLALAARCPHLTVVTNEVFSGGADYEGDTLSYLRALAGINRALAARADRVAEVVCGLPNWLKGGPA